jgi:NADH:ubiquinone oxidoreductase subunit E
MRLCGKGPNIRFDGKLYHGADAALVEKLLDEIK